MVKFNIKVVILILLFLNLSNFIVESAAEVNTNLASSRAEIGLRPRARGVRALDRLSSGNRINSVADDAAGAAFSTKLAPAATAADTDPVAAAAAASLMSRIQNANANDAGAVEKNRLLTLARDEVQMNKSSSYSGLISILEDSSDTTRAGDAEGVNKIEYDGSNNEWKKLNKSIGNPNNFKVSFDYKFTDNVNWKDSNVWKTFIACTKTIGDEQSDHFMIRGHGRSKNFGVWSGKKGQYTRTNDNVNKINFESRVKHRFTFTYSKETGCEIFVDGKKWVEDSESKIVSYAGWGNKETIFDDNNGATYTWYVGGDYDKRHPSGKNHPIGVEISNIIIEPEYYQPSSQASDSN